MKSQAVPGMVRLAGQRQPASAPGRAASVQHSHIARNDVALAVDDQGRHGTALDSPEQVVPTRSGVKSDWETPGPAGLDVVLAAPATRIKIN